MNIEQQQQLIEYLFNYITDNKRKKIEQAITERTQHVTVVLEDLFQSHNASAVLRSSDCFGVQDMHIVQERYKFAVKVGIAMGASKWVSLHRHHDMATCFAQLRAQGYRIVATTPHNDSCLLQELPLDKKLALVFGTEHVGLSEYALQHADEYVKIPMYGFTESFNVSVSAALCLYHITTALRVSSIPWRLNEQERCDVLLLWLRRMIRGVKEYERQWREQQELAV